MSSPGRGRPPAPAINLEHLEKLCMIHCTDAEIAAFFDVSLSTIERRKKRSPKFAEAMERGRLKGKASLRRRQWELAEKDGKGAITMCIWLGKQILGQKDHVRNEHTGVNGGPIEVADVRAKLARMLTRRAELSGTGDVPGQPE